LLYDVAWVYAVQGKNRDEALSVAMQAEQDAPASSSTTLAMVK
jgi:hypothetical protein